MQNPCNFFEISSPIVMVLEHTRGMRVLPNPYTACAVFLAHQMPGAENGFGSQNAHIAQ